jgi:hypothetical protein
MPKLRRRDLGGRTSTSGDRPTWKIPMSTVNQKGARSTVWRQKWDAARLGEKRDMSILRRWPPMREGWQSCRPVAFWGHRFISAPLPWAPTRHPSVWGDGAEAEASLARGPAGELMATTRHLGHPRRTHAAILRSWSSILRAACAPKGFPPAMSDRHEPSTRRRRILLGEGWHQARAAHGRPGRAWVEAKSPPKRAWQSIGTWFADDGQMVWAAGMGVLGRDGEGTGAAVTPSLTLPPTVKQEKENVTTSPIICGTFWIWISLQGGRARGKGGASG